MPVFASNDKTSSPEQYIIHDFRAWPDELIHHYLLFSSIVISFVILILLVKRAISTHNVSDFFGSKSSRKHYLVCIGFLCFVFIQTTHLILNDQRQISLSNAQGLLDTAQDSAETIISEWLKLKTYQVKGIINNKFISLSEKLLNTSTAQSANSITLSELQAQINNQIRQIDLKSYRGFYLINKNGVNIASDEKIKIGKKIDFLIKEPEILNRVWKQDVTLYSSIKKKEDKSVLYLFFPINHNKSSNPFAVLVLKIDPNVTFSKKINSARIGKTGELFGVDKNGNIISKIKYDAENKFTNYHTTTSNSLESHNNILINLAKANKYDDINWFNEENYEGYSTLISSRWLPDKNIGIVAEIHSDEVLRNYFVIRNILIASTAVMIVIMLAISGFLLSSGRRSYEISQNVARDLEVVVKKRTLSIEKQKIQLRSILESSPIMVIVTQDDKLIYANSCAIDLLKISNFKTNVYDIKSYYKNDKTRDIVQKMLALNDSYINEEILLVDTKGAEFTVNASYYNTEFNDKPSILFWAYDVTETKIMSENLIKTTKIAEKANEYKTQFLANMSHEIRTPMNAIMGMTHLAKENCTELPVTRYLNKVEDSTQILLHIINDILDFSKIESGNVKLDLQPFSIIKLLRSITDMLVTKAKDAGISLLIDLDISISRELIGDDTRIYQVLLNLLSNAIKFTKKGYVLIKLECTKNDQNSQSIRFSVIDTGIGISIKQQQKLFKSFQQADTSTTRHYGGTGLGLAISQQLVELMEGGISIQSETDLGSTFSFEIELPINKPYNTVQQQWLSNSDKIIHLWVNTDNQPLIAILTKIAKSANIELSFYTEISEIRDNIKPLEHNFVIIKDETFRRVAREIQLACADVPCEVIVATNNDSIIDAIKDDGWFYVQKPLIPDCLYDIIFSSSKNDITQIKPLKDYKIEAISSFVVPDAKVLIIDDNDINQELLIGLLSKYKCHIETVDDGQQAVDTVQQHAYDLIFMDMQMPVLDGYEATKAIRNLNISTPIIAMTANVKIEDIKLSLGNGCDTYLSKPINYKKLDMIIREYLGNENNTSVPSTKLNEEEANMSEELKLFNPYLGLNLVNYDYALFHNLLQRFVNTHEQQLEQLKQAMRDLHFKDVKRIAHTMKGVAYTIGLTSLGDISLQIEDNNEQNELWPPMFEDFELKIQLSNQAVTIYLASLNDSFNSNTSSSEPLTLSKLETVLEMVANFDFDALHQIEMLLTLSMTTSEKVILELANAAMQEFNFEETTVQLRSLIADKYKN